EEGTTVPSVSQIENCKTLKEEITTIEQFEEIGSYRDVAKKYMVSVGTTHALMMHLRYKKEREDREMELVNAGLKVNEVEMNPSETYHVPPDEQNGVSDELKDQSACDCPKKGIDEACEAYYGDVSEFETHVKELEERWSEPKELTVEDRWNQVGNMLAGIKESIVHVRRMEIKRVEAEIEERLMKMMAGESA
ncbi:MAG: hypothetical protein Q8911_01405, partial [Bacillota bacterium]|nr:hypothetical protein [Bacillota bacterium]